MSFIAIDFETANPSLESVCQVGVAIFAENTLSEIWHTLIDPEDYFDEMNVAIHGIDEEAVRGAPTFPEIFGQLRSLLTGEIVVHHTGFDKVALGRAGEKHSLPEVDCQWLDTAKVVRRAWPEFSKKGYGLSNVAQTLGIDFKHHTAHEDARAAGEILLGAVRQTGLSVSDWLIRVRKPINPSQADGCARDGAPEGPLFGETLVFTGSLSIPRRRAADLGAEAGCDVAESVTLKTTLLVVGDQDLRKLAGHEKSSKHRKAEELTAKGHRIRIIGESDFRRLICNEKEAH